MNTIENILLPDVGGEEVEIIEICVNVGDSIEEEDAIIVVETEKASMDIPASFSGTIEEMSIKVGDKITEGTTICTMKRNEDENVSVEQTVKEEITVEVEPSKVDIKEPTDDLKAIEASIHTDSASATVSCSYINKQTICTVLEDVVVPDIGGDENVDVIDIMFHVGDVIETEDGLITLETEKATMDVPAPFGGEIKELLIKIGDKVSAGTLIAKVEKKIVVSTPVAVPLEKTVEKETSVLAQNQESKTVVVENSTVLTTKSEKIYASPSIRRLAREFGVDLSFVKGSSRKNRITKEDVKAYVKEQLTAPKTASGGSGLGFDLPKLKEIDFSKFGDIETVELSRIQKISGPSLHRNWLSMPHVTQFDEADITQLEVFRKEQNAVASGYKISPLVFVLKAVAKALELHPTFNASLSSDGNSLILKKYFHIAIAVDTPNGLVVPVIKDVDKKGLKELSIEIAEISAKARDGKLKVEDMQGACFTISSLGGIGGTQFTPIINAPEVAILGLSKSEIKPKYNGETFEPKLMLPLSLSYDHKVIDGANGARFTTTLSKILSDIRLLIL